MTVKIIINMRFLNCFSVICSKISTSSLKVHCRNLHNCVLLRHDIHYSSCPKHRIRYLFKEVYAKFHCSIAMRAKSFRETENEYAHEVLQTIPTYAKSIVKQPSSVNIEDYSESKAELNEFAKVTMHCMSMNINLEDGPFSVPVSNLVGCLSSLSDKNLLSCLFLLSCLPPTPKTFTPNFKSLWNSLDSECVRRLPTWDTSQKLLVADHWFHLRLNRISQYNRKMIEDLLKRLNEMTDAEMVQLMFYINLQRELPADALKDLETRLISVVKTTSIEELGIICLGFFKTKNKLSEISIIEIIIKRFIKEIEVAEHATLVSLLKFLKKSMHLPYTELYIPLLHKCIPYVCKWDVPTCIHLALLASECHVYHPLLLDSIVERIHSIIESARLKDMMKLLQCLSHFNHPPPEKFNNLLFSELPKESRQFEIENQPRVLIYMALYYSYLGCYHYELLNVVLDTNFAQKCISAFPETDLTFAEVDCSTEIECCDYKGNRIGKHFWRVLEKRKGNIDLNSKKPNASARLMNDIFSVISSKENIIIKHILPHMFLPDIIVPITGDPQKLLSSSNKDLLLIPPKNETWACLVIGVPYAFAYRSKHITGFMAMKIRQLKKLGYKTVFVPYFELPRNIEKRKKYLEDKLKSVSNCSDSYLMAK